MSSTHTHSTSTSTDTRSFERAGIVKHALIGLALLVLGCSSAVVLVKGGADTAVGLGIALAVAGLVLLGSAVARSSRTRVTREATAVGRDRRAVLALVLAVIVPPLGVLVGATGPAEHRRGTELDAVAVVVGTIMTLVFTGILIALAAQART